MAGHDRDAIEEFNLVLKMDPECLNARLFLGLADLDVGKLQEAIGQLHKVIDRQPGNELARWKLGEAYLSTGNNVRAPEEYRDLCNSDPRNPKGWYGLGQSYFALSLAAHIRPGDDIRFPLSLESNGAGTEVYIGKPVSSIGNRDVYEAPIGYAAQPKSDKREHLYVRAAVSQGRLGISALHFPCEVLRDYFYVADRYLPWEKQKTFYDILRISRSASPAELRLAFKLRELELRADGVSKTAFFAAERAFNILACPELRACYDRLLANPLAPALFPYGGLGTVVSLGDCSRDGQTFFVRRIVSFVPGCAQRRFNAHLRKVDFYDDHAIYRDSRRKLEVWLDQSAVPVVWDATWNQWKHLLGAKIEVKGMFVESGRYRDRGGEWHLLKWETALPSRLELELPSDIADQVDTARTTYHRFGYFSDALGRIRSRIEREPVEREELRRLCWDLDLPGDFDVAQINWQPDYDPFYYHQLCRRARRLFLFREEYIFDLARVIAVETPRLGHATYLFAKPPNMEAFLAAYIRVTKEDIRQNRGNAAEQLRFLGRIVHGANPRGWLKDLNSHSEPMG
jgi:tetratricopeptide (TPR) repeat protein